MNIVILVNQVLEILIAVTMKSLVILRTNKWASESEVSIKINKLIKIKVISLIQNKSNRWISTMLMVNFKSANKDYILISKLLKKVTDLGLIVMKILILIILYNKIGPNLYSLKSKAIIQVKAMFSRIRRNIDVW